jgi:hypothetical protein
MRSTAGINALLRQASAASSTRTFEVKAELPRSLEDCRQGRYQQWLNRTISKCCPNPLSPSRFPAFMTRSLWTAESTTRILLARRPNHRHGRSMRPLLPTHTPRLVAATMIPSSTWWLQPFCAWAFLLAPSTSGSAVKPSRFCPGCASRFACGLVCS